MCLIHERVLRLDIFLTSGGANPQNLEVLLTLFQPEGVDYVHHITATTHGFENLTTSLIMYFTKPLVCAVFRPHPHAHRTHFDSVRCTHSHTNFCARTRTRTRTFFQKKISKNIFKKKLFFFS